MKRVGTLIDEFSGMGDKHYFCLHSGQECEGWIVSYEGETFHFLDSNQAQDAEPIKLRIGAVDLGTLAFHEPEHDNWIGVRWSEAQDKWIQSPMDIAPMAHHDAEIAEAIEAPALPRPPLSLRPAALWRMFSS